ncbi:MAG: RtcB family protein [Akkermansiaceae bacterium]
MKTINGQDLIDAGWEPGPIIAEMLAKCEEYEARGISDVKYILKLLSRDFQAPPPKMVMREKAAPFSEAIRPETKEEKANVASVRKKMDELLKTPVISRGAIMPDACPASMGKAVIPVGGAIAVENAIIPSAHSADVCCSMFATFYHPRSDVASELDALTGATRFGPGGRHMDDLVYHPVLDEDVWGNKFLSGLYDWAKIHIADQGDGNHFAYLGEIDVTPSLIGKLLQAGQNDLAGRFEIALAESKDEKSITLRVLVTHHGSRGLGAKLYKRGQIAAVKHCARIANHIPNAAAWLDADSDIGQEYWEALQYVGRWTRANHESIHARFIERTGGEAIAEFGNEHNFVWKRGNTYFHGKGATPAWKDDNGNPLLGLVPLNMAEPILMVLGSDNEEFLSFAPHGAGRNISRTALKRQFPDEATRRNAIRHHTKDIDVRWFCGDPDLSETPIAYKNADHVTAQIDEFDLAEVIAKIHPLGCIMAGNKHRGPWSKEEILTPKQKRQIQHRSERRRIKQDLHQEED